MVMLMYHVRPAMVYVYSETKLPPNIQQQQQQQQQDGKGTSRHVG
jgi:hypothetical protein